MKLLFLLPLVFTLFVLPVHAKDYFGLNLATETIDSATQKAKSLFADNHRIEDAGLRIVGNGLLRFYGWFDYMDVRLDSRSVVIVLSNPQQ